MSHSSGGGGAGGAERAAGAAAGGERAKKAVMDDWPRRAPPRSLAGLRRGPMPESEATVAPATAATARDARTVGGGQRHAPATRSSARAKF